MKKILIFSQVTLALLFFAIENVSAKEQITKSTMISEGKKRTYYLFVPDSVTPLKPAPLIVMLHGSGRDGRILIEHWQRLAEREGVILVGPNARNSSGWSIPEDGPQFLYDLVEELKSKHPIQPRRVYLFGHSAGAIFGLFMSVLESKYFAAAAIHAGAMKKENYILIDDSERKIPIAMFVGASDHLFPVKAVRETHDALTARGLPVELTEIANHTHNYYGRSAEINSNAWDFLKRHELADDPKYRQHQFRIK